MTREPALDTLVAPASDDRTHPLLEALRGETWTELPWVHRRAKPPLDPGSVLGTPGCPDRYLLQGLLGHGSSSAVYEGYDRLREERVAIKVFRAADPSTTSRSQAEVTVLRLLRVPGVVGILDQGTGEDGLPFVVMDLVGGEPFPGTPGRAWDDLADVVVGLFEILARVHQAGVIHRDLKPENVQCVGGRPVLLDFGLAHSGFTFDDTLEGLAGTPAYLAPELFRGGTPGPATDLYAVGVMLYECLAGVRPFVGANLYDLVSKILVSTPAPLQELAPAAPRALTDLVTRLMAGPPTERPRSAAEVVRHLRAAGLVPRRHLERLGSARALHLVEAAVRARRPIDVGGARGSGRSRLLDDLEARLSDGGVLVARARPGEAPYSSLLGLLAAAHDGDGVAERQVVHHLERGLVLLVDDPARLDPATRELVDRVRGRGAVVRVVDGDALDGVTLGPLSAQEVAPVFLGHEPIHHVPSDAAALIVERTGGMPADVLDLLECWVRAGFATWQRGRVLVERATLDRLRAGVVLDPVAEPSDAVTDPLAVEVWRAVSLLAPLATVDRIAALVRAPEASVREILPLLAAAGMVDAGATSRPGEARETIALVRRPDPDTWPVAARVEANQRAAELLPEWSSRRLACLVEGREIHRVPAATRAVARYHMDRDQPRLASVALSDGLAVARRTGLESEIPGLLEDAVCAALSAHNRLDILLVRAELLAADPGDARGLGQLCELSEAALAGGGPAVLAALENLAPFADPDAEMWRYRLAAFAGMGCTLEDHSSWLDRVRATVAALPGGDLHLKAWEARLSFRRGDIAGAAALHEQVFAEEPRAVPANAAGVNAAIAWLDAGRLADAERVIALLARRIPPHRVLTHDAMLCSLERRLRYRQGRPLRFDPELVSAMIDVDEPGIVGPFLVTEAAAQWRAGVHGRARELAGHAARAFERCRRPWAAALAEALAVRCGAPLPPRPIALAALGAPYVEVTIQALALLDGVEGIQPPPVPPSEYPADVRREVLSVEEALAVLGG